MADTGKSIRTARTTFNGGNVGGGMPTERSQLVEQEVHQYRSLSTGLEGLNESLANFFNLAGQGIAQVREGVEVGQRAKIAQENDAQRKQAAGDAMLGKEMDNSLSNDLDYYDAFRAVRAQRDGYAAYQDFHTWYLSDWLAENPTGNLVSAREEWAAKNLTGSEDSDYEGQVLASFFANSDQLIGQHTDAAYKYQTQKGIQVLGEALDSEVASGTLTPEGFQSYVDKARKLDPLNAAEAPARVVSALLASANNHPEKSMAVANLLEQPGTGMNGKSYAESWPEQYGKFQTEAEAAYSSINTMKEQEALSVLKQKQREAKTPDDLLQLTVDIYKFRRAFGAPEATEAMLNGIATDMAKIEEDNNKRQTAVAWMTGQPGGDPEEIKKNWTGFLEAQTGTKNILELPTPVAAQIIQDIRGVVPEDLKTQLNAVMSDPRDPAAQARAFSLINTVAETAGLDYALDYLNDTSAIMFKNAYEQMRLTNLPMETILAQVNDAAGRVSDWGADWDVITGKSKADAEKAARDTVRANLTQLMGDPGFPIGGFGGTAVAVPPVLEATVLDLARQYSLMSSASGRGWEAGIKDAMQMLARNSEVLPGADGSLQLRIGVDDQNMRFINEDGVEDRRVRLGLAVNNPVSGRPVNTIEVFRDQLGDFKKDFSWIVNRDNEESVSLFSKGPSDVLTSYGMLEVQMDGRPVIYAAGQEVVTEVQPEAPTATFAVALPGGIAQGVPYVGKTETKRFTIPSTDEEMEALIADLPEGFHFVRLDDPMYGTAWRLAYRPNFGDQRGKNLDERAAEFQPEEPEQPFMTFTEPNSHGYSIPQFNLGIGKEK